MREIFDSVEYANSTGNYTEIIITYNRYHKIKINMEDLGCIHAKPDGELMEIVQDDYYLILPFNDIVKVECI